MKILGYRSPRLRDDPFAHSSYEIKIDMSEAFLQSLIDKLPKWLSIALGVAGVLWFYWKMRKAAADAKIAEAEYKEIREKAQTAYSQQKSDGLSDFPEFRADSWGTWFLSVILGILNGLAFVLIPIGPPMTASKVAVVALSFIFCLFDARHPNCRNVSENRYSQPESACLDGIFSFERQHELMDLMVSNSRALLIPIARQLDEIKSLLKSEK